MTHTINDEHGSCGCTLGQDELPVLVSYSADGDNITVVAVHIAGHEVGYEMFSDDQLGAWAAEIAADRANDLRMAREAAQADLWLQEVAA